MIKFQVSGLKIVEVQLRSHPQSQYQNLILRANKSVICITLYCSIVTITKSNLKQNWFSQTVKILQGLTNPLARRPGLVIPTFGLAEIISCMPDGLVKIYIGYCQTCQYSRIYLYSYMLYVV